MNIDTADVHQTLEFRADTMITRLLPYGLVLCFLGLLGLALAENDLSAEILVFVGVVLAAGLGLTAFALWRRFRSGRPVFVLSPMGIHYRLPTLALVPWREIQGLDVIDVTAGWGARTWTCHDVTVVLVSRQFYDSHLHQPFFRRPQGWASVFIPKGAMVQCALHHDVVSVEPRALHDAVAARWQAFRDRPGEPARTSVPAVTAAGRAARSEAAARAAPTSTIVAGAKPGTTSPRGSCDERGSGDWDRPRAGQSARPAGNAGADRGARGAQKVGGSGTAARVRRRGKINDALKKCEGAGRDVQALRPIGLSKLPRAAQQDGGLLR